MLTNITQDVKCWSCKKQLSVEKHGFDISILWCAKCEEERGLHIGAQTLLDKKPESFFDRLKKLFNRNMKKTYVYSVSFVAFDPKSNQKVEGEQTIKSSAMIIDNKKREEMFILDFQTSGLRNVVINKWQLVGIEVS